MKRLPSYLLICAGITALPAFAQLQTPIGSSTLAMVPSSSTATVNPGSVPGLLNGYVPDNGCRPSVSINSMRPSEGDCCHEDSCSAHLAK